MHRIAALSLAIVLLAAPLCRARDLAVIVNKTNSTSTLTAAELEKVLKTAAPSPDGKKVKGFLVDPDSNDQKAILQRVYKMPPAELTAFAEARKVDIQIVASDEIVLTMVDANPGALGIVNVYSINSQVKVLKVEGKLPMEQGYLLHGN